MYNDLHSYIPCSSQGASLFAEKGKSYQLLSVFIADVFKVFTTTTTTTTTTTRERLADKLYLRSFLHLSVLPYIVITLRCFFALILIDFLDRTGYGAKLFQTHLLLTIKRRSI